MGVEYVEQNSLSIVANPVSVDEHVTDNGNRGNTGIETSDCAAFNPPQALSPSARTHPGGDAALREELAPDAPDDGTSAGGPKSKSKSKWNNTGQARHWCLTFNNYTDADFTKIKQAFEARRTEVVSAIIGKEIGKSGTLHLQGYIHFKNLKRQSAVHAFFGYDSPCMHLSVQGTSGPGKGKPPVAAFRYCMKDEEYYVVGNNLDELEKLKVKTKIGTGRCSEAYTKITAAIEKGDVNSMAEIRRIDAEVAAKSEEYWRGLIVQNTRKSVIKEHPLRPWQEMLLKKLGESFSDREVVFVIDKMGNCGKTWFTDMYEERHGKCYTVGADKRDDISYQLINQIIENGPPNVVFMDAPRARAAYVSSPWLEEIKNGKVVSAKYKSKTLHLPHRPHMVVMMNEFPKKNLNEKGLSDDRYTYLVVDENGSGAEWLRGYREDDGGAVAPGFNLTSYDTIQTTIQSNLPDGLQIGLNRVFRSYTNNNETERQLHKNVASVINAWKRKRD